MPAVIPPPLVPSDLVPITAFDEFAQLAFKVFLISSILSLSSSSF